MRADGALADWRDPFIFSTTRPVSIAGTAVACEVAPGDNGMIHVAVVQCKEGDIFVVAPTSPDTWNSDDRRIAKKTGRRQPDAILLP